MDGLHILGTGRCLPKKVVTNNDLEKFVDTNDEWIRTRTGIEQRYFCEDESSSYLAVEAARKAIENSNIDKDEIGACIVATFSADYATPSTACIVQSELELKEMPCIDVNAACTGFIYALNVVKGMLATNNKKYALVIAGEKLSKLMDFEDRGTCILFGDGAAAAVVELSDKHRFESILGARGDVSILSCKGVATKEAQVVKMLGNDVFRFAVKIIPKCIDEILQKANLTLDEIDYVVCHQANKRIISHVVKKLKAEEGKFYMNLDKYANTSAASIPIVLDEMNEKGMLTEGKKVICVGFGAGLTWGAALLEF